jgi:hypothetical protein
MLPDGRRQAGSQRPPAVARPAVHGPPWACWRQRHTRDRPGPAWAPQRLMTPGQGTVMLQGSAGKAAWEARDNKVPSIADGQTPPRAPDQPCAPPLAWTPHRRRLRHGQSTNQANCGEKKARACSSGHCRVAPYRLTRPCSASLQTPDPHSTESVRDRQRHRPVPTGSGACACRRPSCPSRPGRNR